MVRLSTGAAAGHGDMSPLAAAGDLGHIFAQPFMRNAFVAGTFIALALRTRRLLRGAARSGLHR